MKVIHLPNSHIYHQHLIRALLAVNVDVDLTIRGWGTYLPDVLADILAAQPDVVHLHWPEALCRQAAQGLFRRAIRRTYLHSVRMDEEWGRWTIETAGMLEQIHAAGIKIVWTLHNLTPHESRGHAATAYELLYQQFARFSDGAIHHSRWGEAIARQRLAFPVSCRHAVVPFGYFPDEAPEALSKAAARQSLGLPVSTLLLLTVGSVGPRKHLDLLVDAIRDIEEIPCQLIVAGACPAETARLFTERGKGRVRFAGALSQADLSRLARAADYAVFAPDPGQLTTGAPHVSESFLLPEISAEHPYAREVLGDAAIYFPPTAVDLRNALKQACHRLVSDPDSYDAMKSTLAEQRAAHGWDAAARQTAVLYHSVLEQTANGHHMVR